MAVTPLPGSRDKLLQSLITDLIAVSAMFRTVSLEEPPGYDRMLEIAMGMHPGQDATDPAFQAAALELVAAARARLDLVEAKVRQVARANGDLP
jgi:hypothetical protein